MKRAARGEIVQVEGGHILRSTGRKDWHSKVYTSKGLRNRRVRLSAYTAIQFYDVQDRLGYDRPSKAVDWLINKAKSAIDKLAELPPWNPNNGVVNNMPTSTEAEAGSSGSVLEPQPLSDSSPRSLFQRQLEDIPSSVNSSYMMLAPAAESQSLMNLLSFPHDVMSRDSIQTEDLGLSLYSTLHDHSTNHSTVTDQSLPNPVNFDTSYPRMTNWIIPHQQLMFSQGATLFSQREPLQSNISQLFNHAWEQRPMGGARHQSSFFNGDFQFPGRINCEELNGVVCIKQSSGSHNSHH